MLTNAEYFEENVKEIFEDYLNNEGVTDREIVDFILDDAELYTLLMDKWLADSKLKQQLFEYFLMNQPDSEPDREDR